MKKLFLIFLVLFSFTIVLISDCFSALNSKTSATSSKLNAFRSYEKQPLSFIENQGQVNNTVCYYSKGKNGSIYFTKDAIVYDLLSPLQEKDKNSSMLEQDKQKACNRFTFTIKPVGANRDVRLYAKDKTSGRVNYLLGNNPERWHTNIPLYNSITYRELYKGIDLTIYGTNNQMEYDFIVSPGADPGLISLACEGIDALSVDKKGNLLIKTPLGNLKHLKPRIYQKIDGRRHNIDGSFLVSKNTFSFAVKNYNRDYTLIIDPLTLSYSTYLGGDDNDGAYEIAVDSSGNAYVTGYTWSTNFPSWSGYQWENWGKRDIFVTKFRQGDNALLYSTFLGGIESETGRGIAVDASGNAYVTGYTDSTDFPVVNAYQGTYGGGDTDAFISKLGPDGFTLIYSTFLGGSQSDWGYGIAVDSSGNAYVSGETYSTTFPTKNAYQGTGGGTFQDAFITKLSPAGSSVSYSTYLGGGNSDWANSIALDTSGNAYVTGGTKSSDFPTHNAYQSTYGGGDIDAFISKLGPNGTTLTYSTFLGGSKGDRGRDISVDSSGNAYITGYTGSTDFPLENAYQATYKGGDTDTFISKLGPNGDTLIFSTFLGGSSDDLAYGIAIDTSGNASIIGATKSANFPMHNAYQAAHGGGDRDAFISKLGPGGTTLTYSTFLGGTSDDWGNAIAVDSSGNIYIAGQTASTNFPIQGSYQELFGGGDKDCFFVKFEAEDQNEPPTANAGNDQSLTEGVVVTLDGSSSTDPDNGIDTFQWSQVSGSPVTLSDPSTAKPTFNAPTGTQSCETFIFQLTVTDHGGLQDFDDVAITVYSKTAALLYPDGDIAPFGNPDGIVNVGDALIALRFALGLETPSQENIRNGDVAPLDALGSPNPDGTITVGDALVILRKALGLINWNISYYPSTLSPEEVLIRALESQATGNIDQFLSLCDFAEVSQSEIEEVRALFEEIYGNVDIDDFSVSILASGKAKDNSVAMLRALTNCAINKNTNYFNGLFVFLRKYQNGWKITRFLVDPLLNQEVFERSLTSKKSKEAGVRLDRFNKWINELIVKAGKQDFYDKTSNAWRTGFTLIGSVSGVGDSIAMVEQILSTGKDIFETAYDVYENGLTMITVSKFNEVGCGVLRIAVEAIPGADTSSDALAAGAHHFTYNLEIQRDLMNLRKLLREGGTVTELRPYLHPHPLHYYPSGIHAGYTTTDISGTYYNETILSNISVESSHAFGALVPLQVLGDLVYEYDPTDIDPPIKALFLRLGGLEVSGHRVLLTINLRPLIKLVIDSGDRILDFSYFNEHDRGNFPVASGKVTCTRGKQSIYAQLSNSMSTPLIIVNTFMNKIDKIAISQSYQDGIALHIGEKVSGIQVTGTESATGFTIDLTPANISRYPDLPVPNTCLDMMVNDSSVASLTRTNTITISGLKYGSTSLELLLAGSYSYGMPDIAASYPIVVCPPGTNIEGGKCAPETMETGKLYFAWAPVSGWEGGSYDKGCYFKRAEVKAGPGSELCQWTAEVHGEFNGLIDPSFAPRSESEIRSKLEEEVEDHKRYSREATIKSLQISDFKGYFLDTKVKFKGGYGHPYSGYTSCGVSAFGHGYVIKENRVVELKYDIVGGGCFDNSHQDFLESEASKAKSEADSILNGLQLVE
jgi:hypothetical protein